MARPSGVTLLCSLLFLSVFVVINDAGGSRPQPDLKVRTIPLTRVLRIPMSTLSETRGRGTSSGSAAAPTISLGALDERPEGPSGFDIFDDGRVIISDPLLRRISVFDSRGGFLRFWDIGFAADSVTQVSNGMALIRDARSGELHFFNRQGEPRPADGVFLPERAEARVLTANSGVLARPGSRGVPGRLLRIQLDKPGLTLLSLEGLATDRDGTTYVALETTTRGESVEGINVNKFVRKYAADGSLVCEIADIALDYFVTPVDELRVHNGIVYQLMTAASEIRINLWDTK